MSSKRVLIWLQIVGAWAQTLSHEPRAAAAAASAQPQGPSDCSSSTAGDVPSHSAAAAREQVSNNAGQGEPEQGSRGGLRAQQGRRGGLGGARGRHGARARGRGSHEVPAQLPQQVPVQHSPLPSEAVLLVDEALSWTLVAHCSILLGAAESQTRLPGRTLK